MRKCIYLVIITVAVSYSSFSQRSLRLMSYNIRNAKGMDNKTDYDRTVAVLKKVNADVIALQELDSVTRRSNADVLKVLAEKTGLHSLYGAAINYQGGKYGVGILSKEKAMNWYTIALPGREEERILLVAEFKKYIIFCTHLSLTEADRLTSAVIINKEVDKFTKPIYLLGDLNAEPGSNPLSVLKQKWTLLSGEGLTYPAPIPEKCIDYIMSSNNSVKILSKKVLDEPIVSDHRPVFVKLKIKKR